MDYIIWGDIKNQSLLSQEALTILRGGMDNNSGDTSDIQRGSHLDLIYVSTLLVMQYPCQNKNVSYQRTMPKGLYQNETKLYKVF